MSTKCKYLPIAYESIRKFLRVQNPSEFDTREFIEYWTKSDDPMAREYPRIGPGWQKMVGKNLARFAGDTKQIRKLNSRRNDAQMWKSNLGTNAGSAEGMNDKKKKNEENKKNEIMKYLHTNVFDPVLRSPKASAKLKHGVKYTIMRMGNLSSTQMCGYFWSAVAGTEKSSNFAKLMKKEGFTRFEEVIKEFGEKFDMKWMKA